MVETITRTVSFWRAGWLSENGRPQKFSEMLKETLEKLSTVQKTLIERPDGSVIEIRHRLIDSNNQVFIHCVKYHPGAEGSIVPYADPSSETGELSTVPPPNDSNFLAGSMIAMFSGDDCLYCGEQMNTATLAFYIRNLFRATNRPTADDQFEFVNVMDRNYVKEIKANNVEEIGFNSTLDEYQPDLGLTDSTAKTFAQRAVSLFRGLLEEDVSLNALSDDDLSNINARLSLKLDARMRNGISQSEFDQNASTLISDLEPGFYLTLRNGTRITHETIRLTKAVKVVKKHQTVDHATAWTEMEQYLSELRAAGYAITD